MDCPWSYRYSITFCQGIGAFGGGGAFSWSVVSRAVARLMTDDVPPTGFYGFRGADALESGLGQGPFCFTCAMITGAAAWQCSR